jgi:hypothetical protein
MTGIHAAFDRDPARGLDPEDYILMDYEPELEFDLDEWKRGRCFNCGAWARQVTDGEFECECGDIWNIYEPPPEIP